VASSDGGEVRLAVVEYVRQGFVCMSTLSASLVAYRLLLRLQDIFIPCVIQSFFILPILTYLEKYTKMNYTYC
jgi:hypothetical protein